MHVRVFIDHEPGKCTGPEFPEQLEHTRHEPGGPGGHHEPTALRDHRGVVYTPLEDAHLGRGEGALGVRVRTRYLTRHGGSEQGAQGYTHQYPHH